MSANIVLAQGMRPNRLLNDSMAAKIDAEINNYVKDGFSGNVLVARHNKIILNKMYGNVADLGPNPAFWIASMSKSFTAAAILRLQEQGKLSVNDPLSKFFVDVPADKKQITIHNLLNHTSGLPNKYTSDGITEREKSLKAILDLSLEWKVGEKFLYSSDGYNLLAIIVEVASKMSFEKYLRKEILRPVKLNYTGFWGYEKKTNLAEVADVKKTKKVDLTIYQTGKSVANWGYRGPTGIYSTITDIYKWLMVLEKNKVLNPTSREQLWGKQVLVGKVSPIEEHYYGYGWGVRFKNDKRYYVRHTGVEDWLGHNGVMTLYANGDAYIVLSNAGSQNESTYWNSFVERTLQKQLQQ